MIANPEFYFSLDVIDKIKSEIYLANNNEVFFVGKQDEEGILCEVKVVARGNDKSVAALFKLAKPYNVVIHNHPSGNLNPSDADVMVSSQFAQSSIGSLIVNNQVDDCYVLVEPFTVEEVKPIELKNVDDFFVKGGVLSKKLEGYEERLSQVAMARSVANAFNNDKISAIEAGTGTGKSLAYLVPAILWSQLNNKKVVISTNTINLQEQLIAKDIPFLKENTDMDFSAVVIKGRSNYICHRKISEYNALKDEKLFNDQNESEKAIISWSSKTNSGSFSELNFVINQDLVEKFASEPDMCLKLKCPDYRNCFYYKARRESMEADVIIANHHLLFADISVKQDMPDDVGAVLPPYKHVIIDEAHNIEDIASSYFGFSISRFGFVKMLGRLQHSKHRGRGVLPEFVAKLGILSKKKHDQAVVQTLVNLVTNDLIPYRNQVLLHSNVIFDELEDAVYALSKEFLVDKKTFSLRIKPEMKSSDTWIYNVVPKLVALKKELIGFSRKMKSVAKELDLLDEKLKKKTEFYISTLKAMVRRLDEYVKKISLLLDTDEESNIFWFEWKKKKGYLACKVMPLEVAPLLKSKLYDAHKTVILTSATLMVDNKFDFLSKRIGTDLLDKERFESDFFESPFDYDKQVRLFIPSDVPEPTDFKFSDNLHGYIKSLIQSSKGRAFFLFTSYYLLDKVFGHVQNNLPEYQLLKQGDCSRSILLDQFKEDIGSSLFATDSFWEGVDVSGESLSMVTITKLPFKVPTDPLHEARADSLKKNGFDPFRDYAVPLAILKMKQGIGRLIRHRNDKGVIVILDKRIVTKNYGKKVMRSLFVKKPHFIEFEKIQSSIQDFI